MSDGYPIIKNERCLVNSVYLAQTPPKVGILREKPLGKQGKRKQVRNTIHPTNYRAHILAQACWAATTTALATPQRSITILAGGQ